MIKLLLFATSSSVWLDRKIGLFWDIDSFQDPRRPHTADASEELEEGLPRYASIIPFIDEESLTKSQQVFLRLCDTRWRVAGVADEGNLNYPDLARIH